SGTWILSPRALHFQFSHRFQVAGQDADITDIFGEGNLVNYPTFELALGLFEGAMAGVRYSSTSVGAGLANEWQPYVKFAPLRGVGDGVVSVSVLGAWNGANQSVDGELAAETRAGPLLFSAAVRGFSDVFDLPPGTDDEALVLAGGLGLKLNRYVTLAGDVADLVAGPDGHAAWSAGLHVGIPYTPHTVSILVTNVTSATLEGASAGSGTFTTGGDDELFWGFEFTVPFSGFARWGQIFEPEELREPAAGAEEAREEAPAAGRRVVEIEMRQITFRDAEIRIPVGTTVRWVNRDPIAHTSTADDGAWSSPSIGPGETYEHTFEQPGEFAYHCIPHPFMRGTVIVEGG
ncbi:MAG: cupredoxin domain-containing protein, partial [Gemmatimonadota bacterium]